MSGGGPVNANLNAMSKRPRFALYLVFGLTGFSALTLQVVWQRVISIHAGVDLFSITTVVSAFLAGLGLGSLAGGWLADRLGARRALAAFAASNAGIGVFAWLSIWLFYDLYRSVAPHVGGTLGAFGFHFLLLVVPTTLMGLSLPLVAKGVVERVETAGPLVGRLYAVNTVGAGLGAAVSGWFLVGSFGFEGTTRMAGTVNLVAAVGILALWRAAPARGTNAPVATAMSPVTGPQSPPPGGLFGGRTWPWYVVYGLTGAVALGLELVFFRVIDGLMRSNSYTFGHVLMLYLLLFGAGAALASRFVGRTSRPDRWFLGLQFGVGVAALGGLLALVYLPDLLGVEGVTRRHFAIDGYNVGGYHFSPPKELARLVFVHLLGPLLVMGAPVLLMGASFPFVQALIARQMGTLGRRTGLLLATNIVGNVVGTLVVGFVLLGWLGTSGTLRLLALLLVVPGVAAAFTLAGRRRLVATGVAVGVLGAAVAVFPSNRSLWAYFHSAQDLRFSLSEDRACVNALRETKGQDLLFINAASQNPYPFDDYHILIGMLPALVHDQPRSAMAVGLGIGATPFGMSLDQRLDALVVVEICGAEIDLLRRLADGGAPEPRRLFDDGRIDLRVGDGRRFLLRTDERFDVLTVDVIRPQSAFSGNLYSVEFYELVRSRLAPGGVMSQWAASARTLNSVTEVFPYVVGFPVPTYGSQFFLASQEPIRFDRAEVLRRLDGALSTAGLPIGTAQAESLRRYVSTVEPVTYRAGAGLAPVPDAHLNHDLAPRDEYFLNSSPLVPIRPASG